MRSLNLLIREFKLEDTEAIMQLFYDTVHRINVRDYSAAQVEAWAPKEMDYEQWRGRLQSKMTYIAELEGKVIGFAELEANGHIDCFYCHADYQRMGVGTALLSQCDRMAAELELEKLFTEASITSRPFFERMGFSVVTPQTVERRGVEFLNYVMVKCR
jgi:putative acetyltransferase